MTKKEGKEALTAEEFYHQQFPNVKNSNNHEFNTYHMIEFAHKFALLKVAEKEKELLNFPDKGGERINWMIVNCLRLLDAEQAKAVADEIYSRIPKVEDSEVAESRKANQEKQMKVHPESLRMFGKLNLHCPQTVPYGLLNETTAQYNHSQSLDRLNERGGLGVGEMLSIIRNQRWGLYGDSPSTLSELLLEIETYKKSVSGELVSTEKELKSRIIEDTQY